MEPIERTRNIVVASVISTAVLRLWFKDDVTILGTFIGSAVVWAGIDAAVNK